MPRRDGIARGSSCLRHGQVFPSRGENILLKLFFWLVVVAGRCFWHLLPWDSGTFVVAASGFGKKRVQGENGPWVVGIPTTLPYSWQLRALLGSSQASHFTFTGCI